MNSLISWRAQAPPPVSTSTEPGRWRSSSSAAAARAVQIKESRGPRRNLDHPKTLAVERRDTLILKKQWCVPAADGAVEAQAA